MVRIGHGERIRDFSGRHALDRRELMAGLGAALIGPALPSRAAAEGRACAGAAGQGRRPRPASGPAGHRDLVARRGARNAELRFKRGDTLQIQLGNETTAPIALNWHGIDGVPASEPLLARPPLAPQATDSFAIPLRHAGTFMCDVRLLGDGQPPPSAARALIVAESETVAVDRDEVLLFEDWRLRPDGTAIAAGNRPRRARRRSARSTDGARWSSQSGCMNALGFASSMAFNAMLLQ